MTAAPASRANASADHAAAPSTPRKRGKDAARATGASPAAAAAAAVSREGAKYCAHANPTHTHTSTPKAVPPQALPPGADAARPPPGARALAAGRHAAAPAKAAGRPAREPGMRERRGGRAACQPRERGAGDRRRQEKCPGAPARSGPGHVRQGARAQQRRGTERGQRTARLRAGGREGAGAREGCAGARAGRPGAGSGARDGGRAGRPGRG